MLKIAFHFAKRGWKVSFRNQRIEESVAVLQGPGKGSWRPHSAPQRALQKSAVRGGQQMRCEGAAFHPEDENNLERAGLMVPDVVG